MDRKLSYGARNALLRRWGYPSYGAYLASELWASIRERALAKWGRACWCCGRDDAPVQVHHLSYTKGNLSGRHIRGLRPVCAGCHVEVEFVEIGGRRVKRRAEAVGPATIRLRAARAG